MGWGCDVRGIPIVMMMMMNAISVYLYHHNVYFSGFNADVANATVSTDVVIHINHFSFPNQYI